MFSKTVLKNSFQKQEPTRPFEVFKKLISNLTLEIIKEKELPNIFFKENTSYSLTVVVDVEAPSKFLYMAPP